MTSYISNKIGIKAFHIPRLMNSSTEVLVVKMACRDKAGIFLGISKNINRLKPFMKSIDMIYH